MESGPVREKSGAAPCAANPPPCSGAHCAPQNRGPVRRKPADLRQPRPPRSGAQRAPQKCGPVRRKAADLRQNPCPCSGAQCAPQKCGPVRRKAAGLRQPCTPCSGAHCAPQKCGPVRRKTAAGHTFRPDLYAPRLTNGHGEQCSPLRSRHFVRPAPTPYPL